MEPDPEVGGIRLFIDIKYGEKNKYHLDIGFIPNGKVALIKNFIDFFSMECLLLDVVGGGDYNLGVKVAIYPALFRENVYQNFGYTGWDNEDYEYDTYDGKPFVNEQRVYVTAKQTSQKWSEPSVEATYALGDMVVHQVFGDGRVIGKDGQFISVSFGRYGIKKMYIWHPSLSKKLDE
jgi:hypothetical protein